ncbi:unnamed protein product [Lampetra fluviatilis]
MSKHQQKKNPPAVSSDNDETATQLLLTPGAVAPVMEPTTGADVVSAADGAAESSHQLRPDNPWQRVETQLGALTTALLHLVALVMPIAAGSSPVADRPGFSPNTRVTAAILTTAKENGASAASSSLPRGDSLSIVTPAAKENADHG